MLQIEDTAVNDNTEVEGRTLAVQEFFGVDHAPAQEAIEIVDKAEESNGPLEGMDADDSKVLLRKNQK